MWEIALVGTRATLGQLPGRKIVKGSILDLRGGENTRLNTKFDHKVVLIYFRHCLKYIIRYSVEIRFSEVKIVFK